MSGVSSFFSRWSRNTPQKNDRKYVASRIPTQIKMTSPATDNTVRFQLIEDETKTLKNDVQNFLSIITVQTEQLARQEKLLNAIRDERNTKANKRLSMCWIILFVVVFLLISAIWMGYPTMLTMIQEDTTLHLNVKATPVKLPFITAGVKVRFTMGDLISCVKGTFSGDTIDLSLT